MPQERFVRGRWRGLALVLAWGFGVALVLGGSSAWAGDPQLRWYTIENERVVVHFHSGLEPMAQRTAALAADIQRRLAERLGREAHGKTEFVLSDSSDSANGFATTLPYSMISLYVTAPEDMGVLGDYDEWMPTLLAHEQTHIAQIDNVSGLPALINLLVGKQWTPNQMQPRWLIEGLAIYDESKLSSGGRLRSPYFEMMLRADVVEERFAGLDLISGDPVRWPGGNLYYLYGAKFVEYLAQLYGEGLFATVVADSGDDVIPFAVSRPFYRATGRTIEQLYEAFRYATTKRVEAELARVQARGLREGQRLTSHGRYAATPRFFPAHCRPEPTLLYERSDGHSPAGYYEYEMGAHRGRERLLTRASGDTASIGRDCAVWFESTAPSARRYGFSDLFRQAPLTRSPSGTEAARQRLTVGRRAMDPDVSPDGRRVVYVTNRAGTTTLRIAQVAANGTLQEERALVPGSVNEQVYTPRFSHDGKRVAYSAWSHGGYRDLRIVEVETGRVVQLWHDRALDQQPVFAADDQTLYFSSDRSGISNIYAYHLPTRRLRQVTNVTLGAFMPEPSPDGSSLVYVGYGSRGFDLYVIALDESRFLAPVEAGPERGDRPILLDQGHLPVRPYSPLPSLRPRAIEFDYKNDDAGQRLVVMVSGNDAVGHHAVAANAVFEPEGDSPDLYASYSYGRLPVGFAASVYRISDPNHRFEYGLASRQVLELRTGGSTEISYGFPSEFVGQSISLSHHVERVTGRLPTGVAADPFGTVPDEPRRGILSAMGLSYAFSTTEGTAFGSGNERGMHLRLSLSEALRQFGSSYEGTTVTGRSTGYIPMPWAAHHVLALSGNFGASTGEAGGYFALGGYQDSPLLESMIDNLGQSRVTLRGYPSGWFRGSRLLLGQLEYRAPLLMLDRGISTLPLFFRSLHGSLGLDAGGAFDRLEPNDPASVFHYGVAAELWLDLVLSYRMSTRVLFGYAAGYGDGAIEGGTTYIVVGSGL